MDIKNIIDDLKRLGYSIETMNEVPVIVILQHCWEAFITLLPIALVAIATLTITKE